ncbi:rhamnogalacturonan endolyase [Ranunculus cassubicifolius]
MKVVMDNGLVQVTLSNPEGIVTGISYSGVENLLDTRSKEDRRGNWDLNWKEPGSQPSKFDIIKGTKFKVVLQNKTQVEISFSRTRKPSDKGFLVPLNIDKRFVLLEGSHGFYSYAIYEHLEGWPDFDLGVTRLAFKLRRDMFRYMAVDGRRQRRMPLPDDGEVGRAEKLAYPEAVCIEHAIDPEFDGQVDDKYQYSSENQNNKVHGWMSAKPPVGFWHITPSHEFRTGGPFKQELTSHVGPETLTMRTETRNWPYDFPASDEFPKLELRGTVYGRLLIRDRYIDRLDISAAYAHVGLALPGDAGSWQTEGKGYQFWIKSDGHGDFTIKNIRPGIYNLYASVPGVIGDYKFEDIITIREGENINLGNLVYIPQRSGPTLWEIGYPDRSPLEFSIPDPLYINPLYIKIDRLAIWFVGEVYSTLYPKDDLIYTVNTSDYRRDWFFAQVPRKTDRNSYIATTWKIKFDLDSVVQAKNYTLRVALASATYAKYGKDNAIARHGIHGRYWLFSIDAKSEWLIKGENIIFITQSRVDTPFSGVMYDYIRFEGPPAAK